MIDDNDKKITIKDILASIIFAGILGFFLMLNILTQPPDILISERRIPAAFPPLRADAVFDGTFSSQFGEWAADTFIFRDSFRKLNSILIYRLYNQYDKSGLYNNRQAGLGELRDISSGTLGDVANKLRHTAGIMEYYDLNIYYSLIPDKSSYTDKYLPGFNIVKAERIFAGIMGQYSYIDITGALSSDSFYKTDLHWDQTKITDVAGILISEMTGISDVKLNDYAAFAASSGFYGVYAGQYTLPAEKDIMTYIDIPDIRAEYLNPATMEPEEGEVYDKELLTGIDPYSFFLRGPQPIVILYNSSAPERELYIFRDSFGSSLAPLLSTAYSKITIIDLRYIHTRLLEQYIDFAEGADVLFIYSPQVLGNPDAIP